MQAVLTQKIERKVFVNQGKSHTDLQILINNNFFWVVFMNYSNNLFISNR